MFILAISNNLPILADNIKRVRLENEALAATGQPTVSVFKQLIKAVFSWQTALVVGITVLLLFGKQIGEFVTNLFRSEEAIRSNIKAIDDLTSAHAKGAKDAQGELTRFAANVAGSHGAVREKRVSNAGGSPTAVGTTMVSPLRTTRTASAADMRFC